MTHLCDRYIHSFSLSFLLILSLSLSLIINQFFYRAHACSVIMAYRRPDPHRKIHSNRHFPLQEWDIDLGIPGAENLMHEW